MPMRRIGMPASCLDAAHGPATGCRLVPPSPDRAMTAQTPTYDSANVFAKILRGELPSQTVYEDADTLAIMDIMPRADGHVLVIPKTPARNFLDIHPDDLADLARAVQVVAKGVKGAMAADGITVQQFNESAGGQVVFHIHVHVLPRWTGVALRPHTGAMENQDVLAKHAATIRAALEAMQAGG
jgi:histidine triad (HIT) family protein